MEDVYLDNPVDYRETVKIGDKVRSWDFPVREGVGDRYVEGIVIEDAGMGLMKIEVTEDSVDWGAGNGSRVGGTVHAPYWTHLDWKNRIEILEKGN
jgi:hypothetical protein